MKTRILVLLLVLTGSWNVLSAQQITIEYPTPDLSRSDSYFEGPVRSKYHVIFNFNFPAGNKMTFYLQNIDQLNQLPSLDSLIDVVWDQLNLLGDTLNDPLKIYRVDYRISSTDRKIRVLSFLPKGNTYAVKEGEITQLKIEQDTLNIKLFSPKAFRYEGFDVMNWNAYYVSFLLNHLDDIQKIDKAKLLETIQLLKSDVVQAQKKRKRSYRNFYGSYNVEKVTRERPISGSIANYSRKSIELVPFYSQIGVQYVRGAWAPSVGIGPISLEKRLPNGGVKEFRLMWEPYFFFSRNEKNELTTHRNDFLSFQYHHSSTLKLPSKQIEFVQNFSAGYLIRERGDWFNDHTVKFSLPGLQTHNVLLEPQFFFNDLFENFSPSLKLTVEFR